MAIIVRFDFMAKCFSVIVVGGSGVRFGSILPKQFVMLDAKPVLMHTLERFAAYYASHAEVEGEIILVLPQPHIATWKELCDKHSFTVEHRIVEGGSARFYSVLNALNAITCHDNDAVVAIHDGVRPLVNFTIIETAFRVASYDGSAIPVIPVTDSIRMVNSDGGSLAMKRSELRAVQTPQAFRLEELRQAYAVPYDDSFTDDASVYEHMGHRVTLIDGSPHNIKITNAADIAIATVLLQQNK